MVLTSGSNSAASPKLRGGWGWRSWARIHRPRAGPAPVVRSTPPMVTPIATRLTVPNRLTSTGMSPGVPSALMGFSKDHRRPALGDQAGLDFGHLQHGGDRLLHTDQLAVLFQAGQEITQGTIAHSAGRALIE
jgi:hypothetical protein